MRTCETEEDELSAQFRYARKVKNYEHTVSNMWIEYTTFNPDIL